MRILLQASKESYFLHMYMYSCMHACICSKIYAALRIQDIEGFPLSNLKELLASTSRSAETISTL